mgnify:CR=1 FL=1
MFTVNLHTNITYDIGENGKCRGKTQITLVASEKSGIGHWKIRTGMTIIKTNKSSIIQWELVLEVNALKYCTISSHFVTYFGLYDSYNTFA